MRICTPRSALLLLQWVIIPMFIVGFIIVLGLLMQITGEHAMDQHLRQRFVLAMLAALMGMLLAGYSMVLLYRRRAEILSQLDEERTAMLDIATHQLSTPLATFRWWLELLRDNRNTPASQQADALNQLEEGVVRMSGIIKSLTEAGNLERRTFRCSPECTDVSQLLSGAVSEVQEILKRRKQNVRFVVEKNLPTVCIDRKLFAGVFRELLENASAYSEDGADIVLGAHAQRDRVEITVTDYGCGIPSGDMSKLFTKFYRGSNANKKKTIGTGMGLYIAKNVIQKAKGTIKIRSEVNKGTTVLVYLPAQKAS